MRLMFAVDGKPPTIEGKTLTVFIVIPFRHIEKGFASSSVKLSRSTYVRRDKERW